LGGWPGFRLPRVGSSAAPDHERVVLPGTSAHMVFSGSPKAPADSPGGLVSSRGGDAGPRPFAVDAIARTTSECSAGRGGREIPLSSLVPSTGGSGPIPFAISVPLGRYSVLLVGSNRNRCDWPRAAGIIAVAVVRAAGGNAPAVVFPETTRCRYFVFDLTGRARVTSPFWMGEPPIFPAGSPKTRFPRISPPSRAQKDTAGFHGPRQGVGQLGVAFDRRPRVLDQTCPTAQRCKRGREKYCATGHIGRRRTLLPPAREGRPIADVDGRWRIRLPNADRTTPISE